jgi:hypothetical protein
LSNSVLTTKEAKQIFHNVKLDLEDVRSSCPTLDSFPFSNIIMWIRGGLFLPTMDYLVNDILASTPLSSGEILTNVLRMSIFAVRHWVKSTFNPSQTCDIDAHHFLRFVDGLVKHIMKSSLD